MQPRGVVIAVGTASLIIGMLAVDGCSYPIKTMYLPRQTKSEGFLSRQTVKLAHRVWFLTVVIDIHHTEEHTVCFFIKSFVQTFQGICRQPVVGVEHTDNLPRCLLQTDIAGMCLPLVLRKVNDHNTRVAGGIAVEHCQGTVSRPIVNADGLEIA